MTMPKIYNVSSFGKLPPQSVTAHTEMENREKNSSENQNHVKKSMNWKKKIVVVGTKKGFDKKNHRKHFK